MRKEVRRFVLSSTGNYKWAGARRQVSMAVFNKPRDALGFRTQRGRPCWPSVSPCLEAQLFTTASAHILMMNADVLGMAAAEMRAGSPWDQSPKPQPFQLRARCRAALCPQGGHRPGTERSYRLGQMPGVGSSRDKRRGEQARPTQGNS